MCSDQLLAYYHTSAVAGDRYQCTNMCVSLHWQTRNRLMFLSFGIWQYSFADALQRTAPLLVGDSAMQGIVPGQLI